MPSPTPMAFASASLMLVESLIEHLEAKGVLSHQEVAALLAEALLKAEAAARPDMREAAEVIRFLRDGRFFGPAY